MPCVKNIRALSRISKVRCSHLHMYFSQNIVTNQYLSIFHHLRVLLTTWNFGGIISEPVTTALQKGTPPVPDIEQEINLQKGVNGGQDYY